MCRVRGWNLSYESLTSFDARKKLRELKFEDAAFWNELSVEMVAADLPAPDDIVEEDIVDEGDTDEIGDDSSIGFAKVIRAVVDEGTVALRVVGTQEDGGLVQEALAEDDNEEPVFQGEFAEDKCEEPVIDAMADNRHKLGVHTGIANDSYPGTSRNTGAVESGPEQQGRGRRKRVSNRQFTNFICHNDNKDSDVEG